MDGRLPRATTTLEATPSASQWRQPFPPLVAAPFALMVAAQIAYPLAAGSRALLATIVVAAAFCVAVAAAAEAWGVRAALLAAALTWGLALGVEAIGIRSGIPFGRYGYGAALRPSLLGVPVIVPLAWFALGAPAHAIAGRIVQGIDGRLAIAARIAIGAAALTAWDLFLDPQMLREGFWHWDAAGVYRQIPLSNFVGWLLIAAVLMAVYERAAGRASRAADRTVAAGPTTRRRDDALLALYVVMTVMETVGFLVFFRDPLVGVVGGAAMGAACIAALRSQLRGPLRRLARQGRRA